MTRSVEVYLTDGCGRCALGGTPDCKVHLWTDVLHALRRIVLDSGLTEESKWGMPTYTLDGKNVIMISAFKDNCRISFLKGSLLTDDHGILQKEGPNTHESRMIPFTDAGAVLDLEPVLASYIQAAIDVEKAGLTVEKPTEREPAPEELLQKFADMPELETAFYALTPGRQRGYILFFSAPRQSKTRISRIDKHVQDILNGKGIHDR